MEENTKSVKERIVIISNEIRVAKSGKNDFMKAEYFKPDDIMRALNPLLEKYKLLSHFDMTFSKDKEMYECCLRIFDINFKPLVDFPLCVTYRLDIPMQELKGAGMAQSTGATMTYAKRYMLMNIFGLADNKADLDNPKNKPADKIDWESKLKIVKNIKELQELWVKIPANEKKGLETLKDLLKEEFTTKKDDN